jgi:hypothetical protein
MPIRLCFSFAFVLMMAVNAGTDQNVKTNIVKKPAVQGTSSQIKPSTNSNCAKFSPDRAQTMTAIALAESGGNTGNRSRCK